LVGFGGCGVKRPLKNLPSLFPTAVAAEAVFRWRALAVESRAH